MTDVAREAGVSQTTVSFVLRERTDVPVAPETRQRILDAARLLGYRPNRAAQQLRSRRPATIGIITLGIASGPFAGQTVSGAQRAAHESGHVAMLVDVPTGETTDAEIADLVDHGVAGVLFASQGSGTPPIGISEHLAGLPLAFSYCWPAGDDDDAAVLLADDRGGGRAAAAMVFDAGHRDVAYLGGTPGEWSTDRRWEGFLDAAGSAGVDAAALHVAFGDYATPSGHRLTHELWATGRRPSAIVAGNDRMALGALLALHELGLRVPDDVSLVGFDDQEGLASELSPSLSTVALPFWQLGYLAVRSLIDPSAALPAGEHLVPCVPIRRGSIRDLRAS